MATSEKVGRIAFGLFEVDLNAGELWKAGFRVRLPGQPFKVLVALLAKPGEVVTREELQLQVWGSNTNVDFERALAGAINKVREALGDSADNPRFIETLTKRGYRFIAPVTSLAPPHRADGTDLAATAEEITHEQVAAEKTPGLRSQATSIHPSLRKFSLTRKLGDTWSRREILLAGLTVALILTIIGTLWQWRRQPEAPPLKVEQLTYYTPISIGPPNMETLLTLGTDGDRVLTSVMVDGRPRLSAIYISTGEVQRLAMPQELASNSLADISKDGSKLLLRSQLSSESEQPLWVVPSAGGSALRVGNIVAHDASWMPDGGSILYANGNDLFVIRLDDGSSTPYARLAGRAFWLRWSPDGKLLRFTLMDPLTHSSSLWELESGSRVPRPVPQPRDVHLSACCGTWTADGSVYVFSANDNLWQLKGSGRTSTLTQLTNGPLRFLSPVAARSGSRIFFMGLDQPSGLQQFVENRHEFQPVHSFLASATRIDYSRDGKWVAWTDVHQRLWRARVVDGSDKVQLTPSYLEVFLSHWSPDGKRLAVMARERGNLWQTYLIDAAGGKPEVVLRDSRNVADPGWSPDGKSLVFGREPDLMGKESGSHAIHLIDLENKKTEVLPGSEGLFSPRWSYDGRWIVALTLDQQSVMLYDVTRKQWKKLAATSAADPVWSTDSKWIYVHAFLADKEPLLKISVPNGETQTVADLTDFHGGETANYFFGGLTPTNVPLVQPRIGTGDLYTLDLEKR